MKRRLLALALLVSVAVLGACGSSDDDPSPSAQPEGDTTETTAADEEPTTIRLGHFPNITHATAIVGIGSGIFEKALGDDTLQVQTFNAGPDVVTAILSGALDASYIGPNPAINAFARSNGGIRIVSGATSGGAFLVTKPEITNVAGLKGKKIASPQLGNTQDVALRAWLKDNGIETTKEGGGDVSILPQENAQTLEAFKSGAIDGAWVPEPWATRLIQEGGAKVLVDEATLWPEGKFVTTHLIVATSFLEEHPGAVKRLLEGQVETTKYLAENPAESKTLVNKGIEAVTGKPIKPEVLDAAWENLEFTDDPIAASLEVSAEHAIELGLLEPVELDGIYDLDLLNEVREDAGLEPVEA